VTDPADDYVADFVAGISRLKLISAAKIMQPKAKFEKLHGKLAAKKTYPTAGPEDDLDRLIGLSTGTDLPVLIKDGAKTIGVVDKNTLLRCLQGGTS